MFRSPYKVAPPDPDASTPLLSSPLGALFRRIPLIFTLTAACGLLSATYSLTLPNTYQASGQVLVRTGSRERSPLEAEVVGGERSSMREADVLQDVLQLLDGISTTEKVVEELGVARMLAPFHPDQQITKNTSALRRKLYQLQGWWFARGSADAETPSASHPEDCACSECRHRAIKVLQGGVTIALEPRTRVIRVTYSTFDPKLARDVVNAYQKVMVDRYREIFGVHPSYEFLRQEKATAVGAAEVAQQDLIEYLQQCDVYDVELQSRSLLNEVLELEQNEATLRRRLSEIKARQAAIEALLDREQELVEQPLEPATVANPNHQSLVSLRNSLHLRRFDLLPQWTEDSEQIRALDAELQTLEERLQGMEPILIVPREGFRLEENPTWSRLRASWELLFSDLDGAQAELEGVRQQLDERRDRLRVVQDCSPVARVLEVQSKTLSKAAEDLSQAYEDMTVRNALYQEAAGNLRIIEPARIPTNRAGPPRSKLTAAGLMGGFGMGVLLAFLLAMRDRTLRSAQDVRRHLHAQVLAVIPHLRGMERS